MLIVLGFAFIAGMLTILAPCTLPVVPLVLGASATGGPRRSVGILIGFSLMFVTAAIVLAAALAGAGLTTDRLRLASAIVLGLVGLSLISSRIAAWPERHLAPVAGAGTQLAGRRPGDGFAGGLVLGGAIGLVWAPCVGPIMAAVIATAATRGPSVETVLIALAFVAGAAVPVALLAALGRRARNLLTGAARRGYAQRAFGVAMLLTAVLVFSGLDVTVENAAADLLPAGWSDSLIAVEGRPDIQQELALLRPDPSQTTSTVPRPEAAITRPATSGPAVEVATLAPSSPLALPKPVAKSLPDDVALEDLGPAPELTGITAWINSHPMTLASLRGKVVLVHFWTFGCINCIHVQPYVKAWYERYESAGFVVIGIHTPELSFERDLGNVKTAVKKADVRFPVAFDPAFATWNAYQNGYWPSFFFIDRAGNIRHTHIGEGDYDGSEQVIRELLSQPG